MNSKTFLAAALSSAFLILANPSTTSGAGEGESALKSLRDWISSTGSVPDSAPGGDWTKADLTRAESDEAAKLLWKWFTSLEHKSLRQAYENKKLTHGEHVMPFEFRTFGEKPDGGRSLFISMHGGGGAPARVNDQQWKNQIGLYEPTEGIYVAPRAPTDTWNLWHQSHIDPLFADLILMMVLFEDVNPDRVYLMGYSAGGDGVYQLAPRMADSLAAAAMMAGHPNETKPDGLRNLPFALYMGGKDSAYQRNEIAAQWKTKLADLAESDPGAYIHRVVIYPEFGHWMQRKDAEALPWMMKYTRNPHPTKIIWLQDDVTHDAFYWLGVPQNQTDLPERPLVTAEIDRNSIKIESEQLDGITIFLNDQIADLDEDITISFNGTSRTLKPQRTIGNLIRTLISRRDPAYLFPAVIESQSAAE